MVWCVKLLLEEIINMAKYIEVQMHGLTHSWIHELTCSSYSQMAA